MPALSHRINTFLLLTVSLSLCTGCSALPGRYGAARVSLAMPGKSFQSAEIVTTGNPRANMRPATALSPVPVMAIDPLSVTSAPINETPVATVEEVLPFIDLESGGQFNNNSKATSSGHVQRESVAIVAQRPVVQQQPAANVTQVAAQSVARPPVVSSTVARPAVDNGCGCDSCDTSVLQTQQSLQSRQIAALLGRVTRMETSLSVSKRSIATLTTSLAVSHEEVERLQTSVGHWQGEVKRLEAAMQTQHEADIKSLSRISDLLGMLMEETTSAPDVGNIAAETTEDGAQL